MFKLLTQAYKTRHGQIARCEINNLINCFVKILRLRLRITNDEKMWFAGVSVIQTGTTYKPHHNATI